MQVTEEHRWPCAQCGAQLRYAPGQTELTCDHCGHVQTIPAAGEKSNALAFGEHDLAKGLKDDLPDAAMAEVRVRRGLSSSVDAIMGALNAASVPQAAA